MAGHGAYPKRKWRRFAKACPCCRSQMSSLTRSRTAAPRGALGFWRLPGGFEELLARWSAAGPVAYVEAEYFGGVGEQRAAVWVDGTLALGPLDEPTRKRFSRPVSPISQALRRLGARRTLGEDEFEAVGLDSHRNNEDWLSSTAPY
ncbi:hypothetical protein GCM10017687_30150 [Streptomyces echinatus]